MHFHRDVQDWSNTGGGFLLFLFGWFHIAINSDLHALCGACLRARVRACGCADGLGLLNDLIQWFDPWRIPLFSEPAGLIRATWHLSPTISRPLHSKQRQPNDNKHGDQEGPCTHPCVSLWVDPTSCHHPRTPDLVLFTLRCAKIRSWEPKAASRHRSHH